VGCAGVDARADRQDDTIIVAPYVRTLTAQVVEHLPDLGEVVGGAGVVEIGFQVLDRAGDVVGAGAEDAAVADLLE